MMSTLLTFLIANLKNMRDTKKLTEFTKNKEHKDKEMALFKNLKKEVEVNANGTREYVIKKGINWMSNKEFKLKKKAQLAKKKAKADKK